MSAKKYLWTALVATFNMSVLVLVTLLLTWHLLGKRRVRLLPEQVPGIWRATADLTLCAVINDIWFYYFHR